MKEQFANYKIALKFKQLGFDEECFGYYKEGAIIDPEDVVHQRGIHNRIHQIYNSGTISAPIWQQVIDWLREKHDLHVEIHYQPHARMYCYSTRSISGEELSFGALDKYTNAREQAILKALTLIK